MTEIQLKAYEVHKMWNKYVCYVQVNSIPESVLEWMNTNPREQTNKTKVAKAIKESLIHNDNFHELNSGIVMSASNVRYDSFNNLYITFENPKIHGNINGGHGLRLILDTKKKYGLPDNRYVFMEIFEGLESPVNLAKARNTSSQVDDKSIAELDNQFEPIKKVLKNLPFADKVKYKMNEHGKNISIEKIISILIMFNQEEYPVFDKSTKRLSNLHPIQSYNVRKNTLQKYIDNENRELTIKNMQPIIADIFKLWDKIETTFPDMFNKTGKKYGTKKYSKYDENKCIGKSCFYNEDLYYKVPDGIIYPLLASFRPAIRMNENGLYYWEKDVLKVWDTLGEELVKTISNNANLDCIPVLGKDYSLWSSLLQTVYIYG